MKPNVPISRFHIYLAKDLFHQPLTQEEGLCLMLILHACKIRLSDQAKVAGGAKGFAEITSRDAAEVVASLFSSGPESHLGYWYELLWGGDRTPYSIIDNPPDQLLPTLRKIKNILESHPWVEKLEDEDWELLTKLD